MNASCAFASPIEARRNVEHVQLLRVGAVAGAFAGPSSSIFLRMPSLISAADSPFLLSSTKLSTTLSPVGP